jgi:pyrroline-5-carboxylate reductase
MKKKPKIGIIGFGKMGSSLGFALKEKSYWEISIYDKDTKKIKSIKGFFICKNNKELIKKSKIIILAIKPQEVKEFIEETKEYFLENNPLLITILAGISTKFFERHIKNLRIIRVMPNLPAKVKKAVSFICKGKFATQKDLKMAEKIFSCVGETFICKESFLDKATSITGSGPGYIYYIMDCMYKSAKELGFNKEEAEKALIFTFLGAIELIRSSQKSFSQLVKEVASPKGTTEAALEVFKKNKLPEIIKKGIERAYKRAKEISKLNC